MIRSRPWTLLAIIACACFALTASSASAEHVQCGDVITQDTRLDSDVVCPRDLEGPALVIGADKITVDLRGFSVVAGDDLDTRAITTDRPRHGVTIRDGTVGSRTELGSYISVELSQSTVRNVRSAGSGGVAITGDLNKVTANTVFASFSGIVVGGDENRVTRNGVRAIEGTGIWAKGRGFEIARNTVTLDIGFHDGIEVWDFEDIEITRNVVSSTSSEGIQIGTGRGALVDRNIVFRNATGILVESQASEVVLSRNQANNNASTHRGSGTGIHVASPSTLIERNTANDNLHYGIWAVPGAIDGGGNTASRNGIADCVNVTCR